MNKFKKIIFLMTAAASLSGILSASEATQGLYHNGDAYEGSRRASSVTPLIVVGTAAAAAAIAILVTNDSHNHSRGHSHSHSHSH